MSQKERGEAKRSQEGLIEPCRPDWAPGTPWLFSWRLYPAQGSPWLLPLLFPWVPWLFPWVPLGLPGCFPGVLGCFPGVPLH